MASLLGPQCPWAGLHLSTVPGSLEGTAKPQAPCSTLRQGTEVALGDSFSEAAPREGLAQWERQTSQNSKILCSEDDWSSCRAMTETQGCRGLPSIPPHLPLLPEISQVPISIQDCRNGLWGCWFSFPFLFHKTRQDVKGSEDAKNIPQIPPSVQVFTRRHDHDSDSGPFISLPGGGRTVAARSEPSRPKLAVHWGPGMLGALLACASVLPHCLPQSPSVILPGTLTAGSPRSWKISTHVFLVVWMTSYDQLCFLLSFWAKN